MLQIYNSLTKSKQSFEPIEPGVVRMYACGQTVYDYCHIGHARAMIMFDIVLRYFRYCGYEVNFVRNITDIDDKIINRANENNEPWDALTTRFIDAMHKDECNLGVIAPDHEPRATQYVPQIIELIEHIIASGHAYVGDNGDVYFDVAKFEEYGKLSHRDIDSLLAGARIEINEAKRAPLDFVLWKMSKPNEPAWESPWGLGRPGWHIECSAMATSILGQPFDIHGGGLDLKFPHHENEIAQSESVDGTQFANIWMHIGLLQINDEKMSKSLGNFLTIQEVLAEHHAEVIRYFMMSGHYRSPVNYTQDTLNKIAATLQSLYISLRGLATADVPEQHAFRDRFEAVMDDDFNTPEALAVLFEISHEINRLRKEQNLAEAAPLGGLLQELGGLLGILQIDPEVYLRGDLDSIDAAKIDELVAARNLAREMQKWEEADQIRAQLDAMGVVLEDGSEGTTWRKL